MNVNERKVPLKLLKLEAILGRLQKDYPKIPYIKENIAKIQAGYNGEKVIDYQLGYLPHKDYFIFHDIRLEVNGRYFQIDTLILTNRYILILEVKNIAGLVRFDTIFNQLIQTKNGIEIALPDPILQINRQQYQFKEWIKKNHLPLIPIHGLVVISNPQTVISTNNEALSKKVIHAASLPNKITQLQNHFHNQIMSDKEIRKTIRLINKGNIPLIREFGYWRCQNCRKRSKNDHIEALKDYYLLFGNEITSCQLREFLLISSPSLATRLINSAHPYVQSIGTNKGRIYKLDFDLT